MHRPRALEDPSDDLALQTMSVVEGGVAPSAPVDQSDLGIEPAVLSDLVLRAAYTVPQFNTEWAARRLHLPQPVVGEILEQQRTDHLLDVLGSAGPFGFRYSISSRGRERAARLLEVTSYVGPAPVSLEAYSELLAWQLRRFPKVTPERVAASLEGLVLEPNDRELAGLAASSARSLFISGPPGNGKTTLGRSLHSALEGELWVPYCIGIEGSFVRVFDPQCHQMADAESDQRPGIDRRWIKIRRPLIIVGGEMTLESCDLTYSRTLRYYEAPMQMKANGGTLLIDDFGRQRVDPHDLLNRWIIPLEQKFDYLTLATGQKFHVPFELMLIVATNLSVDVVTDPAFLRRMGYRLYLDQPTAESYAEIFQRYAGGHEVAVPGGLIERLLERYRTEERDHRGCEPRDLIERARDICRFRGSPFELSDDVLDLAWAGFFGSRPDHRS